MRISNIAAGRAMAPRWVLGAVIALTALTAISPRSAVAQKRRPSVNQSTLLGGGLRTLSSQNFRLVTDLPDKEARDLLLRLETMLKLVSGYFGKRNIRTIDMYVAKDIEKWPGDTVAQLEPAGIEMIRAGGGLTMGQTALINGRPVDAQAVVYAVADHGTPQHEAVHAYCLLAFGALGPVWYSEGMAEVGQYWKEGDKSVTAAQEVIDYLRSQQPRSLDSIVNNPLETTGDSWQNYAWRWALCHLLGHNENYTDRFKPLGLGLLNRQQVDFWQVYGSQSAEIDFEYQLFHKNLEGGYRVDLCSWDWKSKPVAPRRTGNTFKVQAARGWQAAKVQLKAGVTYRVDSTGEWTVEPDAAAVTANGGKDGRGRLVGCLFQDYELTDEFELGTNSTFVAPVDGALFVRCRDAWGAIADNKGSLTCKLVPVD